MTVADASGGGVTVPGGDPAEIAAMAAWHSELGNALELQYGTIKGAAEGVINTWNGEAATAYYQLSQYVANHWAMTAFNCNHLGLVLKRYSSKLAEFQQQSRTAMHEAEYWLEQQNSWETKLKAANTAVTTAQGDLEDAQRSLAAAHNPASNPLAAGPFSIGHNVGAAQAVVTRAQEALTGAQTQQRTAVKELRHAAEEAMAWQRRGHQIWLEATHAAEEICGVVGRLPIAPPPLAGWARSDKYTQAMDAPKGGGGGLLGDVLGIVQDASSVISGIGGVCAATMFWNPIGDGCGAAATVSGGVSAVDGWVQAATGNGSVGSAALDTGLAGAGFAGGKIIDAGSTPIADGRLGALDPNKTVSAGGAVGATLEGSSGAASTGAGIAGAAGSPHGRPHK